MNRWSESVCKLRKTYDQDTRTLVLMAEACLCLVDDFAKGGEIKKEDAAVLANSFLDAVKRLLRPEAAIKLDTAIAAEVRLMMQDLGADPPKKKPETVIETCNRLLGEINAQLGPDEKT